MTSATQRVTVRATGLKKLLLAAMIGLGSLAVCLFVTVHWIERQIFSADNWVALVAPLPKEPIVRDALGNYISGRVFNAADVKTRVSDALPPRAAFLADPLTSQLQGLTNKAVKRIVEGDGFQTIWSGANRIAINRVTMQARGQPSPLEQRIDQRFNLDLSDVRTRVRDALGSSSQAMPALQDGAGSRINISVDLQEKRQRVHQFVRTIDYLAAVLPLFIAATLLTALALSGQRRRTVMIIASVIFITLLCELVVIKILRQNVLGRVRDTNNIEAVAYIYDAVVGWLRHMIFWVLGTLAVLLVGCSFFGSAAWALAARSALRLDHLPELGFAKGWRNLRLKLQQWQTQIYISLVATALLFVALFMEVNARSIVNAVLATIALGAIVRIVVSPPYTNKLDTSM